MGENGSKTPYIDKISLLCYNEGVNKNLACHHKRAQILSLLEDSMTIRLMIVAIFVISFAFTIHAQSPKSPGTGICGPGKPTQICPPTRPRRVNTVIKYRISYYEIPGKLFDQPGMTAYSISLNFHRPLTQHETEQIIMSTNGSPINYHITESRTTIYYFSNKLDLGIMIGEINKALPDHIFDQVGMPRMNRHF